MSDIDILIPIITILNIFILLKSELRINAVIFAIISNLLCILLYCLNIDNFLSLKEIAIATIIYSISISFLILSKKNNKVSKNETGKVKLVLIALMLIILSGLSIKTLSAINIEQKISQEITSQKIQEYSYKGKFKYLENKNNKDHIIFKRFADFIIIICTLSSLLFLGTKQNKNLQ